MAGRVVGVVGRMGSGKSYFAVRLALKRLRQGVDVCTSFSLDDEAAKALGAKGSARRFQGWEQFAELENCVVIIDEAHLWAPSSQSLLFPHVARWKLSQARKFGIDLYWISQHEDRVNRQIRDLTNLIYVCNAWFDHLLFTAKGYEPEKLRRKDQHIDRKMYLFRAKVAGLYDTLEVQEMDDHLADEKVQRAHEIGRRYNARRQGARGPERSEDRSATPGGP